MKDSTPHHHKKVPHHFSVGLAVVAVAVAVLIFVLYEKSSFLSAIPLFGSQGVISIQEYSLMLIATLLMLIVVIPVFIFTFFIVWKYRTDRSDKKSDIKYNPEWDHSALIEGIWWLVPCIIIIILSVIVWETSHSLNPYAPIASDNPPLVIQVVALDWKWLFIYPQQGIATVNYIEIPVGTPVDFKVTADAPMNSFWIPRLGGQIYAMPGMSTQLHLEALQEGSYNGLSANISGTGFAGMTFTTKSVSNDDFNEWVKEVKETQTPLTEDGYDILTQPSQNDPVQVFSSVDQGLYSDVIMKYMDPASSTPDAAPAETNTNEINANSVNMSGMEMGQ